MVPADTDAPDTTTIPPPLAFATCTVQNGSKTQQVAKFPRARAPLSPVDTPYAESWRAPPPKQPPPRTTPYAQTRPLAVCVTSYDWHRTVETSPAHLRLTSRSYLMREHQIFAVASTSLLVAAFASTAATLPDALAPSWWIIVAIIVPSRLIIFI